MYGFESRVRYSECDERGRLSLPSMVNYLQDASTFQSMDVGSGFETLVPRGIAWILACWRIEVAELPRLGDRIRVSTWCYEMTRSHALRCFSIAGADGRDLVRADSQWFVLDTTSGRVVRVPEDQRVYLSDEPRAPMGPLERRAHVEGQGREGTAFLVRTHNLDTNRHMNNAQYVLLAHDALEELGLAGQITGLTVIYRRMALLGDVVVPAVRERAGGVDVDLTDRDGASYALVRFDLQKEEP
ncbi:MAG TPA: acyl-[acyl-carrier-protein] thioesterase [Candidatus Olsenella excrementigallinarum]|nr:acyl-[acyl-carrier-protein] thioesterase [Candidatus Olsenella excrementigallinarum]